MNGTRGVFFSVTKITGAACCDLAAHCAHARMRKTSDSVVRPINIALAVALLVPVTLTKTIAFELALLCALVANFGVYVSHINAQW